MNIEVEVQVEIEIVGPHWIDCSNRPLGEQNMRHIVTQSTTDEILAPQVALVVVVYASSLVPREQDQIHTHCRHA